MEKKFKTLEEAVDYLNTLRDSDVSDFSDEEIEICQLPHDENDRISEEDIDDNILTPVVPADVFGHLSILSNKKSEINLLSVVANPLQVEIFFDNFFTSYDLMKDLASRNFKAIGTIRENRCKNSSLMPSKEMKKARKRFL